MTFVCEKMMPLDGSVIHPGVYEVKVKGDDYIVVGAQGKNHDINLISTKEELLECGYLITYKYWLSYMQSDGGLDINYVLVDGKWQPYSEATHGKGVCNWDDAELIAESDVELPIKRAGYDAY